MKSKLTSSYWYYDDLMKVTGLGRDSCYKLIRKLNEELKEQGKIVYSGRVSIAYAKVRLGIQ